MLYLWTKYRGAVVALILYDGTNSVEGKAVFGHVGTSETVTKNGEEFEAAVECFMASTEATFECFQVCQVHRIWDGKHANFVSMLGPSARFVNFISNEHFIRHLFHFFFCFEAKYIHIMLTSPNWSNHAHTL